MKLLRLNAYFLLPGDFSGDLNAAIADFTAYKDADTQLPSSACVSVRVAPEALYLNSRYGLRATAEAGVWALEGKLWRRQDKNPYICYDSGATWIK